MIPILDLSRPHPLLRRQIHRALQGVLKSGQFILGPEVGRFEEEFARFCRRRFAVGVASGTDALELALRALGVGPGDRVATVSFTFLATVDAVQHVGAQPLFVDVDPETYTLDPEDLSRKLAGLGGSGRRRLKAILPVHLYGHPCNMDAVGEVAHRYGVPVVEDCAQAAGGAWKGRPVGSLGEIGAFSFFPSKSLGGCGDGGMAVTDSPRLAAGLRRLRVHGRRADGRQVALGRNSRLDELQAAVLRVKLRRLPEWVRRRQLLAAEYTRRLGGVNGIGCPTVAPGARHAFCLYTIRAGRRRRLIEALAKARIACGLYYDLPVHRQPFHRKRFQHVHLPETERAAREVLSLPLFPELTSEEQARVCEVVQTGIG